MTRHVRAHDPSPRRRRPAPVEVRQPHGASWALALEIAEGDTSRLTVEKDGSVVVHNNPVRRSVSA